MRLSEDVIRYMTVKQEGPLPTPKPSSKTTPQSENKESLEAKVESKESQPVTNPEPTIAEKVDSATTENAKS